MKDGKGNNIRKLTEGLAGLFIVLIIITAVNIIFNNMNLRVDFTEEKLYSLSEGTKAVLGKLESPVTLKLFYSKSHRQVPPQIKAFASQVEDLLNEYERAGNGMLVVEHYDPKPDSDDEEWAYRYGITGQPINMLGEPFYFGLAASSGAADGSIAVIDPRNEQMLEYDITRLIHRITNPEKPTIGVMSSLPVLGDQAAFPIPGQPMPEPGWITFQELKKDYHVRQISAETKTIGKNIDTLIILHPKDIPDETLYAIDQYVLSGGHAIVLVDPFCTMDESPMPEGMGQAPYDNSSTLDKLLSAWGVGFEKSRAVADSAASTRVNVGNRVQESPFWLSLYKKNLASEDILTTQIESILLPFSGAFVDNTPETLEFQSLIATSEGGALINTSSIRYGDPASIRLQMRKSGSQRDVAVRLTGEFKTAFPDGPPTVDEGEEDEKAELKSKPASLTEGESSVLLIADADFIYDQYSVRSMQYFGSTVHQPFNDNITFFLNAVEQMAGSADLIKIRSRGRYNRPFDEVLRREAAARKVWQEKEDELQTKLTTIQNKLRELQSKKPENQRFIMSKEQTEEIRSFQKEVGITQKKLREVRKNLRKDIENLGVTIKLINIALLPLTVSVCGIAYGLYRRKRK